MRPTRYASAPATLFCIPALVAGVGVGPEAMFASLSFLEGIAVPREILLRNSIAPLWQKWKQSLLLLRERNVRQNQGSFRSSVATGRASRPAPLLHPYASCRDRL